MVKWQERRERGIAKQKASETLQRERTYFLYIKKERDDLVEREIEM